MLPPLFELENNFESCIENHNQYCKVDAKLKVPFNYSDLITRINEIKSNYNEFDRSFIHRGICLTIANDSEPIEVRLSKQLNQKLEIFNVTSAVDFHVCTNGSIYMTTWDNIVLYSLLAYTAFVIFITCYDVAKRTCSSGLRSPRYNVHKNGFRCTILTHSNYRILNILRDICNRYYNLTNLACDWEIRGRQREDYRPTAININNGTESILCNFSLMQSWKKRMVVSKNEDYLKLLSMQGIRFVTMNCILMLHIFVHYFLVYIENPEALEKQMLFQKFGNYFGMFIVLSYFVMSSWLSTLQAYNIFERHGQFSLKHIGIIIINRYCRFLVALLAIIIWSTNWMQRFSGPLNFDVVHLGQEACKKNWFYNIFYISNYQYAIDMCNPISWYLAADFQMYIINIFIVYATFKFKLNDYKTYGLVLIVYCFLQSLVIYYNDINVHMRPVVRNMEQTNFKHSPSFLYTYTSTTAVASSSCIGMIMGAIYYKNKKLTKKFNNVLWAILLFGLTTLAVLITMQEYGRLTAAILGALVKPMYSLGIGIGILGMSNNIGGILKKLLENRYCVFFSHFSFSTYLSHIMIVVQLHRYKPLYFDQLILLADFIVLFISAWTLGIFVTLLVEEPFLSLQKRFLPQIKKDTKVV